MQPSDFDYELPADLVARYPLAERRDSRLLIADPVGRTLQDTAFAELSLQLRAGDLLVFNDTRVLKARLRGRKASGGKVEVLIERCTDDVTALAQVRASKAPRSGGTLELPGGIEATVIERRDDLFLLGFPCEVLPYLDRFGEVPLPPYLGRAADAADQERYQTVYARCPGAVAAPTAGLHFDDLMLRELQRGGVHHCFVTLHVGAGTFQPLREENLRSQRLHAERVHVGTEACRAVAQARAGGGRVIAVGTTAVRALETASGRGTLQPFNGDTELFILPGYEFRSVDAMLTNFHLPRSSLLMLVSAFAGREFIRDAYRHAVARHYRFFSYGDAMLIVRRGRAE